jgi:hypothetical protein
VRLAETRFVGTALLAGAIWITAFGLAGSFYLGRVRRREAAGWAREDAFVAIIGSASVVGVAAMAAWRQSATLYGHGWTLASFGALADHYGPRSIAESADIRMAAFGLVLALPAAISLISAGVGIVRKQPALATIASGFRFVGLTLGAALMLGYALLMPRALRQEDELRGAIVGTDQRDWNAVAENVNAGWMRIGR